MEEIRDILDKLAFNEPFSFARFNDGEMQGILQPGCTVARGDQTVNKALSGALRDALIYEQDNYYKGIPCSTCFPTLSVAAEELTDGSLNTIPAVVLINRNWGTFFKGFMQLLQQKPRPIIWVGGSDQDIDDLPFRPLIKGGIRVPSQDGWSAYDELKNMHAGFQPGDLVILSCGPLSRVLAKEWFEKMPEATYLDVGSAFDPWTRNIRHRFHMGILPPCDECN